MKITVKMDFYKSTKYCHVYQDKDENTAITSIYIKKHSLPSDAPKQIEVTVTDEL